MGQHNSSFEDDDPKIISIVGVTLTNIITNLYNRSAKGYQVAAGYPNVKRILQLSRGNYRVTIYFTEPSGAYTHIVSLSNVHHERLYKTVELSQLLTLIGKFFSQHNSGETIDHKILYDQDIPKKLARVKNLL
jgi:hypothetical protein